MRAADCLRLAFDNLRQNPLRTMLCALSVAVGTGALLLIAVLGLFGRTQIQAGLQTLGVSGLTVYLDDRKEGAALDVQTVTKMTEALPQIASAMPIKAKTGSVRAGHRSGNAVFLGANQNLGDVMHLEVLEGALLTERQAEYGDKVVVLGDELAQTLYGRENIVGRTVRLRMDGQDTYYTVIGVVKEQTGALGGTLAAIAPHLVYIPYACLATPQDNADQVFVQCASGTENSAVSAQITRYLTDREKIGGTVRVQNMSGVIDTVQQMTDLCTALFVAVGAVTLAVALIGVLCSMLAATHEKTGEIGVYLALGARRRDILRLFLLQSVMLCGFGGLCGLGLAAVLLRFGASMTLQSGWLGIGLLALSMLCGGAAGLLPAVRAAGLRPVDAMRK